MMNRAFSPSSGVMPYLPSRHSPCHRSSHAQISSGTPLSGSGSKTYAMSPSQFAAASRYSGDSLMRTTYSFSHSSLGNTATPGHLLVGLQMEQAAVKHHAGARTNQMSWVACPPPFPD